MFSSCIKACRISAAIPLAICLCSSLEATETPTPRQPNLVVIYADDLGYGDTGAYGNTIHRTPHIDQLAAQGALLTDFYMTSPVCTPSRVALLTGRHPARVGFSTLLWPTSEGGLPQTERTLAEILREAGYRTALIGKWHLGHSEARYLPRAHGFEEFYGMPYPNDMGPGHPQEAARNDIWPPMPMMRNESIVEQGVDVNLLTQQYTAAAVAYIAEHHHEPFFLMLSQAMPHSIVGASPDFRGRSANGLYGDAVEELDWSVGEIQRALRAYGLTDNTLIVFTSDNGAVMPESYTGKEDVARMMFPDLTFGSNAPLRGGKQATYEGGVRLPGIFVWPGTIPGGQRIEQPAWIADLLPTFLEMAGITLPSDRDYDGLSLKSLLTGQSASLGERMLGFGGDTLTALRSGDWKLVLPSQPWFVQVDSQQPMLYNLAADIGEAHNLASDEPAKLEELLHQLEQLQSTMRADRVSR